MAYYRGEIEVESPIEEAFAYLADFTNTAEWDPGVLSSTKRGDGPLGVGTEFKVVTNFLGQKAVLKYRIAQLEPPSRIVLEAENVALRSVDTITFEKTATGTHIVYDANLALKGLRYAFDFVLHLGFQLVGGRALDGMRKAFEERAAKEGSEASA